MAIGTKVFLSIGSNVGDRAANIRHAIRRVQEYVEVTKQSNLYETEPVGETKQGRFFNCVIEVFTDIPPIELLDVLKLIENKMGRKQEIRWGPRVIDLDILVYGSIELNEGGLVIPHMEMHKRRFVLIPLQEIEPGFVHPLSKKGIPELLKDIPESLVKIIEEIDSGEIQ